MTGRSHPPAPWRLHGRAIVIPASVRAPGRPHGHPVIGVGGPRTVGGLLLADYGPRSTLAYHELLGIGGFMRAGPLPAAWITHAHVDDPASREGGRAIWGIPKEDAVFQWHATSGGTAVKVSAGGTEIVSVTVAARPRRLRIPVAAPFVGRDGSRRSWVLGFLCAAPVSVRVRVPAGSPLDSLQPAFSRTALVGDVDLRVGRPARD